MKIYNRLISLRFISLITALLLGFPMQYVSAQISYGGQPYSFSHRLEMPQSLIPDRTELQYKNLEENKSCSALEFARFFFFF